MFILFGRMSKLAAVVPCYNNVRDIGTLVRSLKNYVNDVVVVDDGSKDCTYKKARNAGAHVIKLRNNGGKANAVRVGLDYAINKLKADEILTHLDGDGEHLPYDIPALRAKFRYKSLVIGFRKPAGFATLRNILYFELRAILARTGVEIKDPLCGFRLFGKEFGKVILKSSIANGFGLELEEILLATQRGYTIRDVPLSSYYKEKSCPDANMGAARREVRDNLDIILKYSNALKISEEEKADILYGFFGVDAHSSISMSSNWPSPSLSSPLTTQ
jgi:glycosyltransferase involved in cell wall biosynthesis